MFTPERAVEIVEDRRQGTANELVVYWLQVVTDREVYAKRVESASAGAPILPIILRGEGFTNPNSVLSDVNKVLVDARLRVEQVFSGAAKGPFVVLILSRVSFQLPQISSPTVLPEWFPRIGGQTVDVLVEDLDHLAEARINAPESRIEEICLALVRLERALVARLAQVQRKNQRLGQSFFDLVKDEKVAGENFDAFLEQAQQSAFALANPAGFRPSARDGKFLTGRLMRLVGKSSPDEMTTRARSLVDALDIRAEDVVECADSLTSVSFRPVNRDANIAWRVGRNILWTTFGACQYVTAAAHSDDYPAFPIILLRSHSYDLRRTLQILAEAIERLARTDTA
jgi:hypothetical protein